MNWLIFDEMFGNDVYGNKVFCPDEEEPLEIDTDWLKPVSLCIILFLALYLIILYL